MSSSLSESNAEASWSSLRQLFLDRLWLGTLIVALLAVPISTSRYLFTGWQAVYGVHVTFLAAVVGAYLLRRHLSYQLRALLLIALLDFTAIGGIVSFALLGSAWSWILMAGLLSGMLFTWQSGVVHAAAGLLFLLVVGGAYTQGLLALDFDANVYVTLPIAWATLLAGPALLTICSFWAVAVFFEATHAQLLELEERRLQKDRLVTQLETSLAEVKTLRGLIPICSHCKKIRDDRGYWQSVEAFIARHTEAQFSHGLCPSCGALLYGQDWEEAMAKARARGDLKLDES